MTHRPAFTIIELLVVISIIVLLLALLLPSLQKARESGRTSTCLSNLRQIGIGMQAYLVDQHHVYPHYRHPNHASMDQRRRYWYQVLNIGKYLGGGQDWWTNRLPIMFCPSHDIYPLGNLTIDPNVATLQQWAYFWGVASYGMTMSLEWDDQAPGGPVRITPRADDVKSPSQTILVSDSAWYHEPRRGSHYLYNIPVSSRALGDDGALWPRHSGACNVLWIDGHATTHMAPASSEPDTLYDAQALTRITITPNYWDRQ